MPKRNISKQDTNLPSVPTETTRTKLGIKYKIPVRDSPQKPGRKLTVIWDERFPLKSKFRNKYSYLVSFLNRGDVAGNHVHKKKSEIFIPTKGSFQIILLDPVTKTEEKNDLKVGEAIYIPARIAHVVVAKSKGAILTVIANHPNKDTDEFEYQISK